MIDPTHLHELCCELRVLLDAEIAAGNRVAETSKGLAITRNRSWCCWQRHSITRPSSFRPECTLSISMTRIGGSRSTSIWPAAAC